MDSWYSNSKRCQFVISAIYLLHMANKIRVLKDKNSPQLDPKTVAILFKFLTHAVSELGLEGKDIKIRLLGGAPNEPITTGAYSPQTKTVTTIIANRHLIDYCRTIAHELTHMKQDYDGRLDQPVPEIGGEIEDEANVMSGRLVKFFIKSILTKADKIHLGLGTYGS